MKRRALRISRPIVGFEAKLVENCKVNPTHHAIGSINLSLPPVQLLHQKAIRPLPAQRVALSRRVDPEHRPSSASQSLFAVSAILTTFALTVAAALRAIAGACTAP